MSWICILIITINNLTFQTLCTVTSFVKFGMKFKFGMSANISPEAAFHFALFAAVWTESVLYKGCN